MDFPFRTESLSFDSHDGIHLYGSSTSSNSRGSRSWVRGDNNPGNHQFLVSNGIGPYFTSPVDISPAQQWIPPAVQEISTDEYGTSSRVFSIRMVTQEWRKILPFDVIKVQFESVIWLRCSFEASIFLTDYGGAPLKRGICKEMSVARNNRGSTSSQSDSSCDYESMIRSHPSHRNRSCFMPKAIQPLSFPSQTTQAREFDPITTQRDGHDSSGSPDFVEAPELSDYDLPTSNCFRCSICERFLSQRSPWGPRRIIKNGDMPVSGVLACRHVFHAECLDQTTLKARKNDPPCPVCVKMEEDNFSKLRNDFPRLIKPFCDDAPNKLWGCAQAGDCVEGALHASSGSKLLSLKYRRNLPIKASNSGREVPGKVKKNGSFSPEGFVGPVGQGGACSSKRTGGSGLK
ncbi:hypothetical protein OROGR_003516 [Orobanche gracilis]